MTHQACLLVIDEQIYIHVWQKFNIFKFYILTLFKCLDCMSKAASFIFIICPKDVWCGSISICNDQVGTLFITRVKNHRHVRPSDLEI